MTKAEAWKQQAQDIMAQEADLRARWGGKPRYRVAQNDVGVVPGEVNLAGSLTTYGAVLTPEQALAFARWILEIFSEGESA